MLFAFYSSDSSSYSLYSTVCVYLYVCVHVYIVCLCVYVCVCVVCMSVCVCVHVYVCASLSVIIHAYITLRYHKISLSPGLLCVMVYVAWSLTLALLVIPSSCELLWTPILPASQGTWERSFVSLGISRILIRG